VDLSVHPYAALLDAIGFYVERANGTDVLVEEIEGGVLVAFLTDTDQRVVTLDGAQLVLLRAEIAARESPERPRPGIRLRGLLGRTDADTGGPAPAGPLRRPARGPANELVMMSVRSATTGLPA
jgi:hypothetical protein